MIFELASFRFKSSLSFRALFPFQVLSSSWKSCLSFEATSCLLEATSSFRSLLCCGWLAGRKRMDPCFGFKSSLSFEIIFFENFCFLFEVLSFRFKCFLFVWSHVFRLKTSLFVRNLLFHSKPCLSFKVVSLFPIFFFVSNPFFLFEILSPFSIYFFVSNPFVIFEIVSFRFKSSLSFRALFPFQVLSSMV